MDETTDVQAMAATIEKLKGLLFILNILLLENNKFCLFRCYKKYKYCHETTLC